MLLCSDTNVVNMIITKPFMVFVLLQDWKQKDYLLYSLPTPKNAGKADIVLGRLNICRL